MRVPRALHQNTTCWSFCSLCAFFNEVVMICLSITRLHVICFTSIHVKPQFDTPPQITTLCNSLRTASTCTDVGTSTTMGTFFSTTCQMEVQLATGGSVPPDTAAETFMSSLRGMCCVRVCINVLLQTLIHWRSIFLYVCSMYNVFCVSRGNMCGALPAMRLCCQSKRAN
jgi:hypothetical protein